MVMIVIGFRPVRPILNTASWQLVLGLSAYATDSSRSLVPAVNGINVDDLFALIEGVRRNAAKSKTNWRVTTTWQGQTRSRAHAGNSLRGGLLADTTSACANGAFQLPIAGPPAK